VTVLRQILIVLVGLGLAAAMVVLGVWQLDVYTSQGSKISAERAAAAPLALRDVAAPGVAVTNGFGRSVSFSGRYDPTLQILVPVTPGSGYRVLSGLRQADGSVVPVVRGVVSAEQLPPTPEGQVDQTGVLLPSEENAPERTVGAGQLDAVRVPLLAQRWDGELVGGFVTLSAGDAQAQGLQPAPLDLPQAKGRLRNAAYAFQWWLFGAFAVAMSIRIARDAGLKTDLDALNITDDVSPGAT
jgi:surfeit locus 1 family protein